jgi:hypothetical protein
MTITVRIANNYGNRVVYPVCQRAHTFADIAGTKTLTDDVLALIQQLGFGVVVQQETL